MSSVDQSRSRYLGVNRSARNSTTRSLLGRSLFVLALLVYGTSGAQPEPEVTLSTLEDDYREAMTAKEYEQAIDAARFAVYLVEQQYGEDSSELIDHLMRLGAAQEAARDGPGAIQTYGRAASVLESTRGPFSLELIDALAGIGRVYRNNGQPEQAVSAYQEAIHISRRNEGIYNLEQIDLLDALTDVYVALGEYPDADREQRYQLLAHKKQYGAEDPRIAPALIKIAEWYRRIDQYPIERSYLRRAVEVLEAANGPDDPALVEPLREIAGSYRVERIRNKEAEESLQRALGIIVQDEGLDFAEHTATLIELGDYYIVHNQARTADEYYRQAWELLSSNPEGRDAVLGRPQQLTYQMPIAVDLATKGPSDQPPHVDMQFTVTPDGRVSDLKILDSNLPNTVTREVVNAVRFARYRPRYVDGVPVSTSLRWRQTYSPRRRLHDDSPEATDLAQAGEKPASR